MPFKLIALALLRMLAKLSVIIAVGTSCWFIGKYTLVPTLLSPTIADYIFVTMGGMAIATLIIIAGSTMVAFISEWFTSEYDTVSRICKD